MLKTYQWPHSIAFPNADVALVRIRQAERSARGRLRVRDVLREILLNWAGHPIALEESAQGPIVQGSVRGEHIEVSISYAGGDAWLALRSNGGIGLDAVLVEECTDWKEIAELYLEDEAVQKIREAPHQALAFARRWAALEARCKLAKLPLREKSQPPAAPVHSLEVDNLVICIALSAAAQN